MKNMLFRLANKLYDHCYPVYRPLYATWKAFSDRRERAILRGLIRPGMTVVDVGANIGIYTGFFSRLLTASGHVHAFEPAPINFKRLQNNVALLKNVSAKQTAVGERNGSIRLFISDELNVDHRTFDSGDGRKGIDVPVISLDGHFSAEQRVDVVKIDVQGYELSVLRGAERVLKQNPDVKVLMEYWPYGLTKAGVVPSEVLALLQSLGFEIRTTHNPDGPLFVDGLDPGNIDDYCNLIATKRTGG